MRLVFGLAIPSSYGIAVGRIPSPTHPPPSPRKMEMAMEMLTAIQL